MAKFSLDIEVDYDFKLIAISSNHKTHTVSWVINKALELSLSLSDTHVLKSNKAEVSFKKYNSSKGGFYFTLLRNKNQNHRLLPELSTVDYLLKFYDDESPFSDEEIVTKLRKSKEIQAVYSLDVNRLKSKQVLIFD